MSDQKHPPPHSSEKVAMMTGSSGSTDTRTWEEKVFDARFPEGHPLRKKMRMFLEACAELQRENGLTPEGLDEQYRQMDAAKQAAARQTAPKAIK